MIQVVGMNHVTMILFVAFIVFWLSYRYFKICDVKGKPLPQLHGLMTYIRFFKSALANNLHGLALKWAQEHGDIFKINILGTNMVFLNNTQLVRRILNDNDYKRVTSDRPYTFIGRYGLYGDDSVAFNSSSPLQQKRRKAFHVSVKFYGEGVGNVESIILRILDDEVNRFRQQKTVAISNDISRMVLRIMDHLFVGDKPEGADARVKCLQDFETAFDELFIYGNEAFLQPCPWLRYVPSRFKRLFDKFIKARTHLESVYLTNKESILQDEEGGLVRELLIMQKKHGHVDFPDATIKSIVAEATVAGYLTTSSMVNTVIILCIKYPDLQRKLFEEIEQVIGNDVPCLRQHRHRMPVMESFILETLRYNSSAPFLLYHACSEDLLFEDYHIPKDSILVMNAWYSHRHPQVWQDPWTFKADRFLDSDGILFPADHPIRLNLIPFGTGKRVCPGEAFARSRMFLIIVTLLGIFKFSQSPDCELPSLDPRTWRPGAVVGPDQFECSIQPRKGKENWSNGRLFETEE